MNPKLDLGQFDIEIDLVSDEILGIVFRSDDLPFRAETLLDDGRKALVEIDQTTFTLTVGGKSQTLTATEMYDLLKSTERKG